MAQQNPFVEFLDRYRNDPVAFVREVLGAEPDTWQIEFLNAIGRGERRVSVRSGHGVGKSTASSWAMLWYFLTRYTVKVVVTAPTSSQLFDALFAELKGWARRLPPALGQLIEIKQERIELKAAPTEAFISARTARAESPEALQGVHADHVMLVADEASGVPEPVFEAAIGSMSGEHAVTLLLGNPTRTSGFFFNTHNSNRHQWFSMRVSCVDSKRVSPAFVREVAESYGELSNAYRVRVLGEFPRADDDTIISLALVEEAMTRNVTSSPTAPIVWGLDVARMGDDNSALCKRRSNEVLEPIRKWSKLDLMQTCGVVKVEYDETTPALRPVEILVDAIGVGAGVADRLRELGLPVRGVNVSEMPSLKGVYQNLRTELWFKAKAWLEARDCKMPKDDALTGELVSVKYKVADSSGKVAAEAKDVTKKRLRRSPDLADSFVLTFASDAATASSGAYSATWGKPLRRGLSFV
jgi:phage terminase large subunit